jgi:hypothetical protein
VNIHIEKRGEREREKERVLMMESREGKAAGSRVVE